MKYVTKLIKQREIIVDLFDDSEIHDLRLRNNEWNIKEILIHIKDADTVYYERLRRVVSERKPILWSFEQDLWQNKLDYKNQDIKLAKNLFVSIRNSIIESIEMHIEEYGENEAVHSFRGIMNMNQIVEFIIWHTDHHLEKINKIQPIA